MKCKYCKKPVETPLLLIDGSSLCPHCLKAYDETLNFKVTIENQNYFNLGHQSYLQSLTCNNIDENKKLLQTAISMFNLSAETFNPGAILMLGIIYDFDYDGLGLSESERCKKAYYYYNALVNFKGNVKDINQTGKDYDLLSYRQTAAINLLNMLKGWGQEGKKYSFESNYERIIKNYPEFKKIKDELKDEASFDSSDNNSAETYIRTINNISKKNKSPMFMLFTLNGSKLKNLHNKCKTFFTKYTPKTFFHKEGSNGFQKLEDFSKVIDDKNYNIIIINNATKLFSKNKVLNLNSFKNRFSYNDFKYFDTDIKNYSLYSFVALYEDDFIYLDSKYKKDNSKIIEYVKHGGPFEA